MKIRITFNLTPEDLLLIGEQLDCHGPADRATCEAWIGNIVDAAIEDAAGASRLLQGGPR